MTPFFHDPARVEALRAEAERWLGTPFQANAAVMGAGVSCHLLVAELMMATGAVPRQEWPRGNPWHSVAQRTPIIEPALDALPYLADATGAAVQAGDILGFRLGGCVHHVAVALDRGELVHAVRHRGVVVDTLDDPTWRKRLARTWRPVLR